MKPEKSLKTMIILIIILAAINLGLFILSFWIEGITWQGWAALMVFIGSCLVLKKEKGIEFLRNKKG